MPTLQTQQAPNAGADAIPASMRILVVGQDAGSRNATATRLQASLGPKIQVDSTSDEDSPAIESVEQMFDLVVIAEQDGEESVQRIADSRANTAMLWLTDRVGSSVVQAVRERGGVCLALNPSDSVGLRQAIQITLQQKELQQRYAQAVRRLERSHDDLDYLVRALSHDMNANFVLLEHSFSRLTKSFDPSELASHEPMVTHVNVFMKESRSFVNDLVDLARTGSVEMEPRWIDTASVIDEVLFEQHELLSERNVDVLVRGVVPRVWCNEHRIKQILTNLVRNAIKHGCAPGDPGIAISVVLELDGQGNRVTAVRVADNGPGIDPKHHEEIFRPGNRLPQVSEDGSGMGLAIVRKIAEYYEGTAQVEATEDGGTTMLITLPNPSRTLSSRSQPSNEWPSRPHSAHSGTARHVGHDGAHSDARLRPHHRPAQERGDADD